jgi:transcription elongation factor Elf1
MDGQPTDTSAIKQWEAVHKCPRCFSALKLADIDLKAVTTGIVACPNCDWSGPIEIQIIERAKPEM